MFVLCFDKELKGQLLNKGFKLLKEDDSKATFVFCKELKFNFDSIDKKKFLFTNKLTF